jgi:CDP-paratose 2-epimerase
MSDGASYNSNGRPVLITGGAGFIGSNLADRLLSDGEKVVIFDNLSRPGVAANYRWLLSRHGRSVQLLEKDVRDAASVRDAVRAASSVFHFAAQVAVTTSLTSPAADFEVNALGTLNVLEALRIANPDAPMVFTSTNKVYGCLPRLEMECGTDGYAPTDARRRANGIDESEALDFVTPYGCSKGSADQYVRDYARSFGLSTVVFRMSCIYGPRQMGTEDQGWVAHILRQIIGGLPVTIYGDGNQVRDLLFIDDLVEALLLARKNAEGLASEAFNIGGGKSNAVSVRRVIQMAAELEECEPVCLQGAWRPGDQRYYVSNCARFSEITGWQPATAPSSGLRQLRDWLRRSRREEPSSLAA